MQSSSYLERAAALKQQARKVRRDSEQFMQWIKKHPPVEMETWQPT